MPAAFGTAWSPSAALSAWLTANVRLRASAGSAFRIPTFTELYYSDPGNVGSPGLQPERARSVDGGIDWVAHRWMLSASPFARWDRNVIDWVRASSADRWQATNVRDVTSTGLELSATRSWNGSMVRTSYTALSVGAPALDRLSKYVLSYAKQSLTLAAAFPVGRGVHAAIDANVKDRFDGQRYMLVGVELSRTFGRVAAFARASNVLNADYQEVAGVPMPGRWVTAGFTFR